MHVLKEGGHRLFEADPETSRLVSEMLLDLGRNGMDAVRRYSKRFDDWDLPDFELNEQQIDETIRQKESSRWTGYSAC